MKCHIYYFSATGNTWDAVSRIVSALRAAGHDVRVTPIDGQTRPLSDPPDRVLIAFPTLAWAPPALVSRFMRRLPDGLIHQGARIRAAVFTADAGSSEPPKRHSRSGYTPDRGQIDVAFMPSRRSPDSFLVSLGAVS